MEVGGYHIVFLAHTDDVGVAEVGTEHGVLVGTVALVAPCCGLLGLETERAEQRKDGKEVFHFIFEVMGLRTPLYPLRNTLAEPKERNMSRRTGMWLASSVI